MSAIDLTSIYSAYTDTTSALSGTSAKSSLSSVSSDSDDDELLEACQEFETYFIQKLIEEEKKTLSSDETSSGDYMQYFGDTLNESYAKAISESGQFGLAQQLYDSVKQNYSDTDTSSLLSALTSTDSTQDVSTDTSES